MSLEELMNLDVTSVSKAPEPYSQAPAAIDVITSDEIERSGAATIPEALRLADNLDVAQKNPHDWAISARGFNTALSNKLLVLIDGRTVYTPLFSGVFWNEQDTLLEDIDRIEVISGPGGTLWGANAVNGVINITTKSAKDTQGGYLEAGGGSELENFAAARYGGTLAPNVYYRVYAKYFDFDSSETASGASANDGWHLSQAGFRIDSLASPQNTLTLQGDYFGENLGITTGGVSNADGANLLGRWSHTFAAESDMSLQVYYDRTHLVDPIPASAFAKAGILTDDMNTYDVDFQDRIRAGDRNRIVWGLGYRYMNDNVVNAPALAFYPTQLDQDLYSGFAQDEFLVVRDVNLTVGSKFEHNAYTGSEWEPSGRLQWNPTPAEMLWSAVSRAVRTPSRVDRDIAEPNPPPAVLEGKPTYESETVIAYELGYRAQPFPQVSTSLSTFYNSYGHVRSLDFTPKTVLPLFFANDLEGHTYGAELGVDYQAASWWRLHGGYDLLREHLVVRPGGVDLNNAHNETADPRHQFTIRSSMDLPGNVALDAALRRVDTLDENNGGTVATLPAYTELDARIGWRPVSRLELSLVGQNLLHSRHLEYGIPAPSLEEIERTVYGKASWAY